MKVNARVTLKCYGVKKKFRIVTPDERIGENFYFMYMGQPVTSARDYEKRLGNLSFSDIEFRVLLPSKVIGDRVLAHSSRLYFEAL